MGTRFDGVVASVWFEKKKKSLDVCAELLHLRVACMSGLVWFVSARVIFA